MDSQHRRPSAAFAPRSASKARPIVRVMVAGFEPQPERACVEVLSLCRTDGAYRSVRTSSSTARYSTPKIRSDMVRSSTSGRHRAGKRMRGAAGAWRLLFLPDFRHPGGWLPEAIITAVVLAMMVAVCLLIYGG